MKGSSLQGIILKDFDEISQFVLGFLLSLPPFIFDKFSPVGGSGTLSESR